MHKLVRGGLGGVLATMVMTGVIAGGWAAGLLRTPPPAEITGRARRWAGLETDAQGPAFRAGWLAAHLGYGAASGVGYTLLRPLLPRSAVRAGLLYGAGVWGVSYLGVMPALGLYPWPDADSRSRTAVMVAAHAVFGIAVAQAERYL